jgi:hypothetical protein
MNESAKRKCQRLLKNCAKVTQVSDSITSGQVFVAVGTCLVWCYNRHFRFFFFIEAYNTIAFVNIQYLLSMNSLVAHLQ